MDVRAGDLIGAGWGVLLRQWPWLLGGGVIVAAMQALEKGAGLRSTGPGSAGAVIVVSLLVMLVQFIVHAVIGRRAMAGEGLVLPGVPFRYVHYLLVSVIVTVGAFLGAVVLIVPGIMALLRWFVSTNYVLAQGMSCTQAMAASRDATRGHRWTILWAWIAVGLVVGLPYLLTLWAAGGMTALAQAPMLSAAGAARLLWAVVATPVSLAFSIGSYSVLARASNPLSEVFS